MKKHSPTRAHNTHHIDAQIRGNPEQGLPKRQSKTHPPAAASLDNPLYYLENARTLIRWVCSLHADLLTEDERVSLANLLGAKTAAQALLIRMVMRTQTIYRVSQIEHYEEIQHPTESLLADLADIGMVRLDPKIELKDLSRLLSRDELLNIHNQLLPSLPKSASKQRIEIALQTGIDTPQSAQTLSDWLSSPTPSVALRCQPLFDRLRLMFFGNMRQNWSEFVVTELGYFNYEPVELNQSSRAFHHRSEVDQYLFLNQIAEQYEHIGLSERIAAAQSIEPINDWIGGRYARLIFTLGQEAERTGQVELALSLYRESGLGDAFIRELRVLERNTAPETVNQRITEGNERKLTPLHQLAIERVRSRTLKKLGLDTKAPKLRTPAEFKLQIPKPDRSVEMASVEALSTDTAPLAYVENCLINSVFGLLFWDALYAPVPGAFFHPFQSHPADLYRSAFVSKRPQLIKEAFDALDENRHRDIITQRYTQKRGKTNAFIHWSVVTQDLLERALDLIPASHLKLIFERLLSDIRTHRSGFPDLIQFDLEQQSYRLIEVKGPGDRLQDNQKLWLDYFVEHQIPCSVCWVSWEPSV